MIDDALASTGYDWPDDLPVMNCKMTKIIEMMIMMIMKMMMMIMKMVMMIMKMLIIIISGLSVLPGLSNMVTIR